MAEESPKYLSYPFVLNTHFSKFRGKPVSFVGKVHSNSGAKLQLKNKNEDIITVESFNGDTSVEGFVEIRGIVKSNDSIEFKDFTQFNKEFNIDQFEEMVQFYQSNHSGLCF
eukprot:CAMPEP_0168326116 /NCGR_PEP_ID=MMETSP0213-20121227/5102_1 /TAXON_ID=151035 /ORGANISM="Euplotes harpa, Strain FSP1.4" /LENGTH=111 /DNA_ID=CAMNT_0008328751 /DNA_START=103 /DNA_END=438 /DNA_ORIENTATION=+